MEEIHECNDGDDNNVFEVYYDDQEDENDQFSIGLWSFDENYPMMGLVLITVVVTLMTTLMIVKMMEVM